MGLRGKGTVDMRKTLSVLSLLLLVVISTASAQTVVQRVRLGNQVEGMTYINTGPLAKHIVIIDGRYLTGVPAEGRGAAPFSNLFDLMNLGYVAPPRGLAWVDTEQLFIFTDPTAGAPSTTFRLTDHKGQPKGTIVFQWPSDFVDGAPYVEEIAWIPLSAPQYPGMFVFLAPQTAGNGLEALFVMDRKGNLVKEILLNQDPNSPYYLFATGLAYRDGRLLLGNTDGNLYEVDFDGNVIAPPVVFPDATDIEGIAVLAKNRVVITSHSNGKLIYLDAQLNRLPEERSYKVGFGLGASTYAAWNSSTNEYIVYATDLEPTISLPQLGAIGANLKSSHVYADMAPFYGQAFGRIDYLPSLNVITMPWRSTSPRRLEYFTPSGATDGLTIGDGSADYRLSAFAYVPNGFIARRIVNTTVLEFFDMNAQLTGLQLDPSPWMQPGSVVFDVAPFTSAGEQRYLVLTSETPQRLLTLDANGNFVSSVDVTRLNLRTVGSVKYITSGPKAGAFVAMDGNVNEMVVFTLP